MMRKALFLILLIAISAHAHKHVVNPNHTFLPDKFPVYIKDDVVLNFPERGFTKKFVPTKNLYKEMPGCYIACYSLDEGVYLINSTVYLHGMIRVAGEYEGYQCRPTGSKDQDLSKLEKLKKLCRSELESCQTKSGCWAGGDTEGWFNLQVPDMTELTPDS